MDKPLFFIAIFAARVNRKAISFSTDLIIEHVEVKMNFRSREAAELYGERKAKNQFPEKGGWKVRLSVSPVFGEAPIPPSRKKGIEFLLVKQYLDENLQTIKENILWQQTLSVSTEKQLEIQKGILVSFMKNGSTNLKAHQPSLPKERTIFWDKIASYIEAFLESDEALTYSA